MTLAVRPRPAQLLTVGLIALGALVLTGCDDDVVAAPQLTDRTATACAALVKALPDTILGVQAHSQVEGTQVQWGDPSLVLTCGVPQSSDVEAWSACSMLEGVQWYINPEQTQSADSDVTLETLGTDPVVRLDVPLDLRPRFDEVVAAVAPALLKNQKVINRCQ